MDTKHSKPVGRLDLGQLVLDYQKFGGEAQLEQIFQAGRALVYYFARLCSMGRPSEDLIQAGYVGLLKATKRFDPKREVKFATYAGHCIKGEMRHYLRQELAAERPQWLLESPAPYYNAETQSDHSPLVEAEAVRSVVRPVQFKEEVVFRLIRTRWVSLEDLDFLRIGRNPGAAIPLPIEDRLTLWQAINQLSELQKIVIYKLFFQGQNQTQIAQELGIGQRRVSRILHRSLSQMRSWLDK